MARLFIALIHYPVVDRSGRVVASAITSLDLHDLARSARTYGVSAFYIVHPVAEQREFAARVIGHWMNGPGRQFDSRRREALDLARIVPDLEAALTDAAGMGEKPLLTVHTSARAVGQLSYAELRQRLDTPDGPPVMLLFGTGFGLAPVMLERTDLALAPLLGPADYNHLSVRAAAGIILDRLRGQ
ncbi:MAG TPA: RNA methyltransferase [Candidatus Binataceae bacterium]|nr:RNA methyltransferase [Candidatus Binataceae bacterium]